ncbi:NADP-dependent 3-hydroxy acid dehydrogenase YdfG [Humitalea rosea]|uniref:NADP-dependent 3-hydroxy acid dehydrogenase YdfG n=1 Tax=Humitalea rosea TaxID=990373 RepID=A0A2W7I488_9PROT|nr:SDR family oxidoreductase [Humitalea rosea]PZW41019.1 NADP-dependent 3-hydroxy acid dehydrogenase YdfG [Humitalea rosea]
MSLAGKRIWVTGAGSGIGRAVAQALAAEGARLILSGRREAPLRETAVLAGQSDAMILPIDLTDAAAVQAAADAVGEIDILVNNAGGNLLRRHWHQLTAEAAQGMINQNLVAPFLTSLAVLPGMRERGGGLLVQIASMAGKHTHPVSGPTYIAAKHGVVAFSASINAENGIFGIRSTAICPGEVNTPILDLRPQKIAADELARMLQPEDIAAAVLYVCQQPPRVCINEMLVTPTRNRANLALAESLAALP